VTLGRKFSHGKKKKGVRCCPGEYPPRKRKPWKTEKKKVLRNFKETSGWDEGKQGGGGEISWGKEVICLFGNEKGTRNRKTRGGGRTGPNDTLAGGGRSL